MTKTNKNNTQQKLIDLMNRQEPIALKGYSERLEIAYVSSNYVEVESYDNYDYPTIKMSHKELLDLLQTSTKQV